MSAEVGNESEKDYGSMDVRQQQQQAAPTETHSHHSDSRMR